MSIPCIFFFIIIIFFFFEDHVLYFILFSCHIHVQLLQQHFGGHPGLGFGGIWFPIFCDFCKPIVILFTCLSSDPGPSCDILNLVDIADVLRILSRRVSSVMHLKVLKLYEGLPLLLHLLIGPCPVFYACSPVLLMSNFRTNHYPFCLHASSRIPQSIASDAP